MVHGDLKGVRLRWVEPSVLPNRIIQANILIDETRHARLADFGLLTIVSDPTNCLSSSSHTQGGTARWMSPELIDPQRFGFKNSRPTKSSDCYALGMVIYETISGHSPFHEDADITVFVKVLNGEHPLREALFTDNVWEVLERCWEPQSGARPRIEEVLQCLEMEPPLPRMGVEVVGTDDGDDWSSVNDSSGEISRFIPSARFTVLVLV